MKFSAIENFYDNYNDSRFRTKNSGVVSQKSVLSLLKENTCSFKEILAKLKAAETNSNDSTFFVFLKNEQLFAELIENDLLSTADLKELFKTIDKRSEVYGVSQNTVLLQYFIDRDIVSFQELVDKFKSVPNEDIGPANNTCLHMLLMNVDVFEHWTKNNTLNRFDWRHLFFNIEKSLELKKIDNNFHLLKYFVDNEIVTFKEMVDQYKRALQPGDMQCLDKLLKNKELFQHLVEKNKLTQEDLKYLLIEMSSMNTIDKESALRNLCYNTVLAKKILNECVLDKETVEQFDVYNVFGLIEYCATHNRSNKKLDTEDVDWELIDLLKWNKCLFKFELFQRLELLELLKENKADSSRLFEVVENSLEDTFSFDHLKQYLCKHERKTLLVV